MGSIVAPIKSDRAARAGVGGTVPRFVLAEAARSRVGARLAALGWHATISVSEVGALELRDVGQIDVLVAACSERDLLRPAFQVGIEKFAGPLPRVAVVAGAGPEAAVYAARLGWHGFVAAEETADTIALAIAAVANGELSFPMAATRALVRALARVAPVSGGAPSLTPRQRQIVTLISQGATDADIATLLRISRSTAHKHVQNARRRLGAKTRSQLVAASRDQAAAGGDRLVPLPAWRPG